MDWSWLWSWLPPLLVGILATLITSIITHRLQESGRAKARRVDRVVGRLDELRRYMTTVLEIADIASWPARQGIDKLDESEHAGWFARWEKLRPKREYLPASGSPALMLTSDRELLDLLDQVRTVVARIYVEAPRLEIERVVRQEVLGDRDQLRELAPKVRDRCDQLEDQA